MRKFLFVLPFILQAGISRAQISGSFVAMEYRGMSNLIYRVYITPDRLIGIRVNGYISVKNGFGIGYVVADNELNDPEAYVNRRTEANYHGIDIQSDTILQLDSQNFIIRKGEIKRLYHTDKKKFGMGYYPYSGRIILQCIKTTQSKRPNRDFVLVGKQNWEDLLKLMEIK